MDLCIYSRKNVVPPDEYIEKEKARQVKKYSQHSGSKGRAIEQFDVKHKTEKEKEDQVLKDENARALSNY